MLFGETVGIFYDQAVPQIAFAAGDVKTALEGEGFSVEIRSLAILDSSYANKKVVVALDADTAVKALLSAQGGAATGLLGEQAYALRTTTSGQTSYWVIGGDSTGAMYGGLQVAENIKFQGVVSFADSQETPTVLKRGIKLNYALDASSPTYYNGFSTSYEKAIPHVWDMSYWTSWLDEMARNRYNVLSIWNNHPFTSMIKLEGYEDVAIQNVTGFEGYTKTMTIDEKIVFWKTLMTYAHDRGFEVLLFNWNVFVSNAAGKHGLANGATSAANTTYMYKCMVKLLETYPELDGFGVTNGENNSTVSFLWNTYGKGMYDYARVNPARKLRFIHRWHQASFSEIKGLFGPLIALPNVTFDMSYKYSQAHMYSAPVPTWWTASNAQSLTDNGLKTWFTVRNDDYYYHNWGNPDFAREYINGFPGQGTYFKGFYMGSDGNSPTKTFFSKDSVSQGMLEVQRQWYMYMLWGRLSYNPGTPDGVFKNYMNLKYPTVSSDDLFEAWSKASRGLPKVTELTQDTLKLDFDWWPEACWSMNGFVTATTFSNAGIAKGSSLCSIASTAANSCSGKKSSYALADEIEADALSALDLVSGMTAVPNTELAVAINNIKVMSYLSVYYAYKIRGATDIKANKPSKTTNLGKAYCWWMKYSNLMDQMYYGMPTMQRVKGLPNWHAVDAAVLAEYQSNGGSGTPSCVSGPVVSVSATDANASEPSDFGTFTFTRTDNISSPMIVNFTVGGTATSGVDYTDIGTSVTIPAGQASATVPVAVIDDTVVDPSETVIVTLASGAGYEVGSPSSATVTIADNEVPPGQTVPWVETFTLADGTTSDPAPTSWTAKPTTGGFRVLANEMAFNSVGTDGVFTTGAIDTSSGPVTVSLKVRGGGGLDLGQDFLRFYHKVDGGPEVQIAAANGPQAAATWTTNIASGNSLVLVIRAHVTSTTEYYYFDDLSVTGSGPVLPTVTIAASDANAGEPSDNGEFTVTRSSSTGADLTVNFTVSGTATSGSDYTVSGTSVTIPAGQASAIIPVGVIDNALVESSETVLATLASGSGYTIGSPNNATVTIADDEPVLPAVSVTASDANAGEPSDNGAFTFSRTGSTTDALTVNFAVSGPATSDSDYTSIGTSVTIPASQASATVTVAVLDDLVVDPSEKVIVTLASGTGYDIGSPNHATVTIADNEVPPGQTVPWVETFTLADGTTSDPAPTSWTATPTTGSFRVLTNEMAFNSVGTDGVFTTGAIDISSGPVTVSLKVRGGGGLDLGQDFLRFYHKVDGGPEVQIAAANGPQAAATWTTNIASGNSLVLVIRAHVTSTTEFYYFDDLSVTGGGPVGPTVSVTTSDANAGEPADNGAFTFTRTGSTTDAMTVNFTVSGTATSGSDYTSIGTSVTIPAGQASASVPVTVIDDVPAESSETVVVTLASGAGYDIGAPNSATVTITDQDSGLPGPWVTADIGAVAATGSASYADPTFTIKGSGADVISTADEFRYVHQSSSGDCSIVARVTSIQNTHGWAKAGVMVRESTAANARNFFVFITPSNGVSITWRTTAGGTTVNNTPAVAGQAAPKWLKIERTGNAFAAFRSDDGNTWTQVGTTQTISMATTATLGLALTSHADGTLCTSTMDNVTATP